MGCSGSHNPGYKKFVPSACSPQSSRTHRLPCARRSPPTAHHTHLPPTTRPLPTTYHRPATHHMPATCCPLLTTCPLPITHPPSQGVLCGQHLGVHPCPFSTTCLFLSVVWSPSCCVPILPDLMQKTLNQILYQIYYHVVIFKIYVLPSPSLSPSLLVIFFVSQESTSIMTVMCESSAQGMNWQGKWG